MEYVVAYELGGPGTYCKRGFAHFACLPAKYLNSSKEPVTLDRYRRVLTTEQAVEHTCMICSENLAAPSTMPV